MKRALSRSGIAERDYASKMKRALSRSLDYTISPFGPPSHNVLCSNSPNGSKERYAGLRRVTGTVSLKSPKVPYVAAS
jgi:hypothetical protein